jgi:tagatose-6-phosphate ketose/aldose isomerase
LRHTPREIAQQPDTWGKTFEIFLQNQERLAGFLEGCGVRAGLEKRPIVMLVGAGTSDYIGGSLALLLRRSWGCEVFACASTDLLLNLEDYIVAGRNYLWISFSRSGDSPEGVAVLERAIAEFPEMAHLIVTCNPSARMIAVSEPAPLACSVVLDDAVNDRSLAMTSSFTNMVVMGHCLAHAWSIEAYRAINLRLIGAGRAMLEAASEAADQCSSLDLERIFFIGSGALASVAKEAALKVLEMTAGRIKTMSETLLGLRHGPMAALDENTLFVCMVPGHARKAMYARDLLVEVGEKNIVRRRIAIGAVSAKDQMSGCYETYLAVPDGISDLYRPVIDVIFGQLLGLFCSVAHGLKPDAPSPGGVINRVVQPFRMY